MNIVIFGSRNYCRYQDTYGVWHYDHDKILEAFALIETLIKDIPDPTFITGKAHGADMVGMYYAIRNNLPYREFIPDWDSEPRRAGMIRNQQMRDVGDYFFGFWDGVSKGTKEMHTTLRKTNRHCVMYSLDNIPLE